MPFDINDSRTYKINNFDITDGNECNLINGDNIAVMKALLPKYRGKVDCIYIDPPYNNGEKYKYYPDDMHHDTWVKMMKDTIRLLAEFINPENGSLWISIDDTEMAYLKVICDEILGRASFVSTFIWQQRNTRENRKVFSNNHEYILLYTKNQEGFKAKRHPLPPTDAMLKSYSNPDNDPRGPWQSVTCNVQDGHAVPSQFYELTAPNGKKHNPPKGRCWIHNETDMNKLIDEGRIWFGKDGNGVPRKKKYLKEANLVAVPETLWTSDFAGTNNDAKKHLKALDIYDKALFDTPKPEKLIKRIFEIATDEDDLVMDVFLGSGTTAAVAQKMDRRYIGIENNPDTFDYACKRMKCVCSGEDKGGISEDVLWCGGGQFKVDVDSDSIDDFKMKYHAV